MAELTEKNDPQREPRGASQHGAPNWLESLRAYWAERWQQGPGFLSLLFGVVLPVITIVFEQATQACASTFFDPTPTLLHFVLVSLVPAGNYLLWSSLRNDRGNRRSLAFANGVVIAVASVYSLLFLPLLPLAAIGVVFFGLGLLPWSPVFALIAALTLRNRLKKQDEAGARRHATWPGLLCGVIALIAVDLPNSLTELGMKMATSPSATEQARGIRLLRAVGNEDLMLRLCYVRMGRATDLLSIITGMSSLTPTQARDIYYRVTGEPFNTKPMPSNLHRRGWLIREFDTDQGGAVVGRQLPTLSLASSRLDGSIDAQAAVGYLEWTLVVKNDGLIMQEARAQIALPPGAVVSRLTLWVNGEEREAAFAKRGQVIEAYQSVVRARRDPVLVTTAGPDRVSVQMFPVPAAGEMKARIGMTVPLQLEHLRQGYLQLPYFHDRNFVVADDFRHSALIDSKAPLQSALGTASLLPVDGSDVHSLQLQLADNQLSATESIITVPREPIIASWSHDTPAGTGFIRQTFQQVRAQAPETLVVVVDGSASMAKFADRVAEVLSRLPQELQLYIIVADDEMTEGALQSTTPRDAATMIRDYEFVGGKDNTPALIQALNGAQAKHDSALLWIHGPQPVTFPGIAALEQLLQRRGQVRWYDVQVTPGANRTLERLDGIAQIHTLSLDKLPALISRWRSDGSEVIVHRQKLSSAQSPGAPEEQTSDHLARLWAHDEVRRLLHREQPLREQAIEVASHYQLVTPVTGAVVLETQQQYDAAGLTPVPEGTVPSIPEPEEWALIVIALFVLLYAFKRRREFQHATV